MPLLLSAVCLSPLWGFQSLVRSAHPPFVFFKQALYHLLQIRVVAQTIAHEA